MGYQQGHGLNPSEIEQYGRSLKIKTDNLVGYFALYNQARSFRGGKRGDISTAMSAIQTVFNLTFDLIKFLEQEAMRLENDLDYLRKEAKTQLKGQKGAYRMIDEQEQELRNNIAQVINLAIILKKKS